MGQIQNNALSQFPVLSIGIDQCESVDSASTLSVVSAGLTS
jgi:hypothetical protein